MPYGPDHEQSSLDQAHLGSEEVPPEFLRGIVRIGARLSARAELGTIPARRLGTMSPRTTLGSGTAVGSQRTPHISSRRDCVERCAVYLREGGLYRMRVATPNHRKAHSAPQAPPVLRPTAHE